MKLEPTRRRFLSRSAPCVCGLVAAESREVGAATPGQAPSEKRLLVLGLNALARAHTLNYFADGHRGAALVSAHLMCVENRLPRAAIARIEELSDLNWANTPLCGPFPEEDADPAQVKKIGEALMEARGSLREVGHNAIFAMLATRGFLLEPDLATPRRIDGVCRLIRAIKPWRDDIPLDEAVNPPPFKDLAAASAFVLREASAAIDRWRGRGQGFSGHMMTFGQALVGLAEMGNVDWAESCREAFRKYVTIVRRGPEAGDKVYSEHPPSSLRPNSSEYWQKRGDKQVDIGHVFKYPYSYYDLVRRVEDENLKRELDEKAWRVF